MCKHFQPWYQNTSVELIVSPTRTDGWLILKVVDVTRIIEPVLRDGEHCVVHTAIDELLKTRQTQTEKTNVWRWEKASEQADKCSPEWTSWEWMNTCHAPRRVTEYGQAADCFSKSGFASFPLVQLSNKKHSSPRGCAGSKWKRHKCICFYSEVKKIKQNKAFSRAWKVSIMTPLYSQRKPMRKQIAVRFQQWKRQRRSWTLASAFNHAVLI